MKVRLLIFSVLSFIFFSSCGSKKQIYQSKRKAPTSVAKPSYGGKRMSYSQKIQAYVDRHGATAMEEMQIYKIPASITLAQGILESASGQSELARRSNNHFGIKCHSDWKGKRVYHDDDRRNECFRKYRHPRESFRDHSLFLKKKRYAFLFRYRMTDYKSWAHGLRKAGYATDRRYPQKLIDLIERYELHRFDRKNKGKRKDKRTAYKTPVKPSKKPTNSSSRVHIVKKGDTLYSLARRYGMTVDALKRLNHLRSNALSIGQQLKLK